MTKVSAVSGYNAYTKAGNPYNRTKVGKKTGAIIGGLGAAVSVAGFGFMAKVAKGEGQTTFKALLELVKESKGIVVARALKPLASAFIVGAMVDMGVNMIRKHKADKAAKQA